MINFIIGNRGIGRIFFIPFSNENYIAPVYDILTIYFNINSLKRGSLFACNLEVLVLISGA
jgi:hypothetical protein